MRRTRILVAGAAVAGMVAMHVAVAEAEPDAGTDTRTFREAEACAGWFDPVNGFTNQKAHNYDLTLLCGSRTDSTGLPSKASVFALRETCTLITARHFTCNEEVFVDAVSPSQVIIDADAGTATISAVIDGCTVNMTMQPTGQAATFDPSPRLWRYGPDNDTRVEVGTTTESSTSQNVAGNGTVCDWKTPADGNTHAGTIINKTFTTEFVYVSPFVEE